MTYIGIDFSLTSPAFCVLKDGRYSWGSLTRTDRTAESLRKSKDKPYAVLDGDPDIDLFFLTRKEMPEEYSARERVKIDYFQDIVDVFWYHIEPFIEGEDVKIAIEGLSFSSNGNALIDISMATALIRKKIVDRIGSKNFYVFPPTAIKKFAGKGNFKKDEMYHALVQKAPTTEGNFSDFTDVISKHSSSWITKSKHVNKPVDDLVDASWICLFLQEILKNE
jgi:Holliday junction resolvasome RuvABC endonuclease subunit